MDCAICLFTFHFLPLNKRLGCTWGTDWYSRVPHPCFWVPGLSWGFQLGFWWCLTSESWSQGLHASSDALRTGKVPRHLRAGFQEQKVQRQETIENKLLLKAGLTQGHPIPPGNGVHDRGSLQGWQDEEIKNMLESSFSGAELCLGGSSHSDQMIPAPVSSYRFALPWVELRFSWICSMRHQNWGWARPFFC